MTDTTTMTITAAWTKISDGQCEVQSIGDRRSYDKLLFDLVVSDNEPASDTDAFMEIKLFEHANFHRSTPVWLRLNADNASKDRKIVIIR
ncbi:hypothetical protein [Psychrobacter piscatorii]|uniref:hypothetical protein n=1 Tax=Psychrobacter piscatorii TaxID=554343 RepID=UPI0037356235